MRKIFWFISIFIFVSNALAQELDVVKVYSDSLNDGKRYRIKNWFYINGDDSLSGKSLDLDTSLAIVQSLDISDSSSSVPWEGRGWFKRVIAIDSSLFNTPIAFTLSHFGASNVYLNGQLVNTHGELFPRSEKFYHPQGIPFIAVLPDTNFITLAVRYSNYLSVHDSTWFAKWIEHKGFSLRIQNVENKLLDLSLSKSLTAAINVGLFGLFCSLGLLYLLLFAFYSHNIENLYYSLFTLSLGFALFAGYFNEMIQTNIKLLVFFSMVPSILLVAVFLFYNLFLYKIFYKKMPVGAWILAVIGVIISFISAFGSQSEYLRYSLFGFILITTIEGIRIIIIALIKKKDNVWIIGSGVLLFGFFIFLVFAINIFGIKLNQYVGIVLLFTGVFSLPVSMAVYLARKIADTNKDLEIQINAVKEFSERELENQKKTAELQLQQEKDSAKAKEAELRAATAELQAKAAEAQSRVIQAENERKTKELEEARELQLSMLPKKIPSLQKFDIAVYMQTATEVGGDYYDFYVDENDILTVAIGDATGHGLNAGTLVTATKSLFTSLAKNENILETFGEITRVLKGLQFRFLSMCLAILKFNDDSITFSSAGIPPLLIYRQKTKKVEEILLRGLPLGVKREFPYELKTIKFETGDTILMMSDGYPELFNPKGELLGYDRVKSNFKDCASKSAQEVIDHLKQTAIDWSNNSTPDDDVTFVVVKIKV